MQFMRDGVAWFRDQMLDAAGRDVVYDRNGERTTVKAWVTETLYETVDAGVPVEIRTRDYKFPTGALPTAPRKGDRFREVINGETHVFEVMPNADSPDTAWVDTDGQITVARCKAVMVET